MFWESVIAGIGLLGKGSVLLGMFLYTLTIFAIMFLTGIIGTINEAGGCLFAMIGRPLLHGILLSVFIAFLLPVLLGGTTITDSSIVWEYLWPIAKAGMLAVGVILVLSFIPIVGGLIGYSPATQILIQGLIIIRLLAGSELAAISQRVGMTTSIYPGFWAYIGYLVIGGALGYLFVFAAAHITQFVKSLELSDQVEMAVVACLMSLSTIPGLLPLLMYAQYIKLSLQHAVGV